MNTSTEVITKKGFSFKTLLVLLIYEVVFLAVLTWFFIFYGPFDNVRKTIVESVMTTYSHKYLVQMFLSDDKIQSILEEDRANTVIQKEDTSQEIKLKVVPDTSIDRYNIKSGSKKFAGYMLVIHDPLRVKVGITSKLGVEGELTSEIAKANNAVAGINAGGFHDKSSGGAGSGTGGQPSGIIISGGVVRFDNTKSRDKEIDMVGLTDKGRLIVGKYSRNELAKLHVTEAVNFGPALVVNGVGTIKKGIGGWGIAPRTAIGQTKNGDILFLVIDGRSFSSVGATLKDVQNIMLQYGAMNASNLDGGSSTTMFYDGKVINNPCDSLGERSVPSAFIVKKN